MIRRLKNKKLIGGLLGALLLLVLSITPFTTLADEYRFVTWEKTGNNHEVAVEVMLSAREDVRKAGTFQVQFNVASDDIDGVQDVQFKFNSGIKNNDKIQVKSYRYNEENRTLTVYVSSKDDDILSSQPLKLGTISVTSDSNVTLTVNEENCKVVNDDYAEQALTVFGNTEPYLIKVKEDTPEETLPEETQPEESLPENPTESQPSTNNTTEDSGEVFTDSEETDGAWHFKDNAWSFTKADGTPVLNDWIKVKGTWYRIGTDGKMLTGWINLNNVWYFCNPSGAMKTGWVNTGNQWYFLNPSGAMKTGWIQEKGYAYYLGESGDMKTGWNQIDGKMYYFDSDGKKLADTVTPDGYRVDRNGVRVN